METCSEGINRMSVKRIGAYSQGLMHEILRRLTEDVYHVRFNLQSTGGKPIDIDDQFERMLKRITDLQDLYRTSQE